MLEIICLSTLALTTDLCPSKVNLAIPNAIELNITTTKVYLAGRHYESDYSREAERERARQDIWRHRNLNSERNRIYRNSDRHDGKLCIDESGRVHRTPDGECNKEREIDRDSERYYPERRNRIHRNPH